MILTIESPSFGFLYPKKIKLLGVVELVKEKKEKALKLKVEYDGSKFTMIENVPNQTITVTTTDAEERKLDKLDSMRWRQNNPEPEFTVSIHTKIEEKLKGKSLTYCGRMFSIVIHTNFKQKETGLIFVNGKAANIASFGKMWGMSSRPSITKTLKEFVNDGLIMKEGTKYYLNKEYHFMGKIEKNSLFAKIYHVSNRDLLDKVSQEALGLLYKVVNLVNYTNGSICFNPAEKDNELVQAMIREELAKQLDLHVDTITLRMNE